MSAGFIGVKVVTKEDDQHAGLEFFFVFNVYAVFDRPDDEMLSVSGTPDSPLNISIKQGKFFQHPQGSPLTPPIIVFNPDPTLLYDTFVTIGAKTDDFFTTLDDVSTTPGMMFQNDSFSTTNGGWFVLPGSANAVPDANGQVLIFQGSFIKDGIAKGIAGTALLGFTANDVPGQSAYVSFDYQVPGPGAWPLLGLAVLVGPRRRRGRGLG